MGAMALSLAACGSSTNNEEKAKTEASGAAEQKEEATSGAVEQKAETTASVGESASTHIYVLTAPEDHGWTGSVATLVDDLKMGEKQLLEISKALFFDAKLLILDEPTTSLTNEEVEHLFGIVKELKKKGIFHL